MAVSYKKKLQTLQQKKNDDIVRSLKPLLTKAQKLEKQIKQVMKLDVEPEIKRQLLQKLAKNGKNDFKLGPNLYNAFDHRAFKLKIQDAIDELDDDKEKNKAQKAAVAEDKDFGKEAKETRGICDGATRLINEVAKNGVTDGGDAFLLGMAAVAAVIGRYKRK